ncbi:unnamed protein product, partial [Polarella glacialis]
MNPEIEKPLLAREDGASPSPGVRGQQIAAQLGVAIPEMGWSVCEPLFMPLLLILEVPHYLLSICWLISPITGLIFQPVVGALSDRYGRKPFILLLGFLAALGLVITPMCTMMANKSLAGVLAIACFGLADMSHDLLVTPTRAQINDVFSADEAEWRSGFAGGLGKFFAMLCSAFLPSTTAFWAVAVAVALSTSAQLFVPSKVEEGIESHDKPNVPEGDLKQHSQGQVVIDESGPVPVASSGEVASGSFPAGFWQLWIMQFAGWLSLCTWLFYFTSVWAAKSGAVPGTPESQRAVQQGTLLLLAGSVVFMAVGAMLPKLSGPHSVLCCVREEVSMASALALLTVTLLSLCYTGPEIDALSALLVIGPGHAAYQLVANVPYAWLERQPEFDAASRGWLTGCFNGSLSAAQMFVAVLGGPIVDAYGCLSAAYAAAAGINILVLLALGAGYGVTALLGSSQ